MSDREAMTALGELGQATAAGPAMHLTAHITHDEETVLLRVRGALSGPRVPLLESVVYRLEKRGRAHFILDLRDVAVIDAAGTAMVSRSEERALRAGRSIAVIPKGRGQGAGRDFRVPEE
jgi:hypothetical protein